MWWEGPGRPPAGPVAVSVREAGGQERRPELWNPGSAAWALGASVFFSFLLLACMSPSASSRGPMLEVLNSKTTKAFLAKGV